MFYRISKFNPSILMRSTIFIFCIYIVTFVQLYSCLIRVYLFVFNRGLNLNDLDLLLEGLNVQHIQIKTQNLVQHIKEVPLSHHSSIFSQNNYFCISIYMAYLSLFTKKCHIFSKSYFILLGCLIALEFYFVFWCFHISHITHFN